MKKFLPTLIIFSLALASILLPSPAYAAVIFSDSFKNDPNGYNSSWYIYPERSQPVKTDDGITGSNTSNVLSTIALAISGNHSYEINFDIKINKENSDQFWSIGIGDDLSGWKVVNTYESLLETRDSNGGLQRNLWNKQIGQHHFKILISPLNNTLVRIFENDQELQPNLLSTANFDISIFWISLRGYGDYELSNFQLCDADGCTDPTIPTTKVIVIPGYFGSMNITDIASCDVTSPPGTWNTWSRADPYYRPLIQSLEQAGRSVYPFYYDWRRDARETADILNTHIENKVSNVNEKVDIVAHSFGGLVARAYLEKYGPSRIDHLLTAGTPHQGTPLAYPAWSGGEIWFEGDVKKALLTIQKWCNITKQRSDMQTIRTVVPSVNNLLPTMNYLYDKIGSGIDISGMHAKNAWLLTNQFPDHSGVTLGTLSGTGSTTLSTISVTTDIPKRIPPSYWEDGYPKGKGYKIMEGDNTVLTLSSQLTAANSNIVLPGISHSNLLSSSNGQQKIMEFLGIQSMPTSSTVISESSTGIAVMAYPGSLSVTNPEGNTTHTQGLYLSESPKKGAYRVSFTPDALSSTMLIGKFLNNGKVIWKPFGYNTLHPITETITFNPEETDK